MRVKAFAKRNLKELFRDPLTLFFLGWDFRWCCWC